MDLNKAMRDLYKQRSASGKKNLKNSVLDKDSEMIISDDEPSKTSFEQLFGFDYVRRRILSMLDHFKFAIDGGTKKFTKPILICGSHGLGKTSLVEAAANHANLKLIKIPLKIMVKQRRNQFEESLEQLIRHTVANQPAIVLIDDLDRLPDKDDANLLIEDAITRLLADNNNMLVFCTTSSPLETSSDIPFLLTIHLKRPDYNARFQILKSICEKKKSLNRLSEDSLRDIAVNTPSFTATDLSDMLDIAQVESIYRGSGYYPALDDCRAAIKVVKQTFKKGTHLIGERPNVSWDDIGGMSNVRKAFVNILKDIKRSGCKFEGIALYGPPGCGKTMVAQAMANEGGFNFISIKPAELIDKYLGETEKNIRKVFQEAREYEPCVIYFDEFDGLCGTRGNRDTVTSAIHTLLNEMNGFGDRGQSIILASTNRLEDIDPAMKRPGRLSRHIYVGPPDEEARRDILIKITKQQGMSLADDLDLGYWASKTEGFTGADLDFLIYEASSRANDSEKSPLRQEHLVHAMAKIQTVNKELAKKTSSVKKVKTCP